ncbi:MAG: SDR family oxidoreductase [Candidatus Thermoplasmatota archaeon]|nr:SDR family oxidoreductase [Candidatus Thermoplasmatota archaeon]
MKKNYVIIGGTSGIGLAVVKELVQHNNHLFVGSRNERNIEDVKQATFFHCDAVDNTFEFPNNIETIDGLMYCPGSLNLMPFKRIKEKDIINEFKINVFGLLNTVKYFLPLLQKNQHESSILLMSSVAVTSGMKYHSLVGATKGAVEGITRSLAAEFAPIVRVNAIAPSITETPLTKKFLSSQKIRSNLEQRHPLQSLAEPMDIAHAAVYLLSEKSKWVTGQILHVDGGLSAISKN